MDAKVFRILKAGAVFDKHKLPGELIQLQTVTGSTASSATNGHLKASGSLMDTPPEAQPPKRKKVKRSKVAAESSSSQQDASTSAPNRKMKRKKQAPSERHDAEVDVDMSDGPSLLRSSKRALVQQKKRHKADTQAEDRRRRVNELRQQHRIYVQGSDIPEPISAFDHLTSRYDCSAAVVTNIDSAGYTVPTPIQMQAIPVMMAGRDLFGVAPTGSGKTAAFTVPILIKMKECGSAGFGALVVSPTRELARQIYREMRRLAQGIPLRICVLTKAVAVAGGPDPSANFDVLITTPLRLAALIREKTIQLDNVQHLVLDEGDKLFEENFLEQVDDILAACTHPNVQRSLFSATLPPQVEEMARTVLRDPVRVVVGVRNTTAATIEQKLVYAGHEPGKLLAIRQLLKEGTKPPILVFVQSKERAKELFRELLFDGFKVDVIHADRPQFQRDEVVKRFRSGAVWVLICTDLMGRGIDFKGVNCVVNYDFPQSVVSYIHRIGRTGRAGQSGLAVTFFTDEDADMLRSIANVMKISGCHVPAWMLKLSKIRKSDRKRREKRPVLRRHISTTPLYDIRKQRKRAMCIKGSVQKRKAAAERASGSEADSGGGGADADET